MRRLSIAWLLSLLLVFAQQGAVLHELGHLSHDPAGSEHSGATLHAGPLLESGLCLTCEAFAQVANPAGAPAASPVMCAAAVPPAADSCHSFADSDTPTPRSRGPPRI